MNEIKADEEGDGEGSEDRGSDMGDIDLEEGIQVDHDEEDGEETKISEDKKWTEFIDD